MSVSKKHYYVTDGRHMIRHFTDECDALLFWTYNGMTGTLQEVHIDTGIVIDQIEENSATTSSGLFKWHTGKAIDFGSDVAIRTAIERNLAQHFSKKGINTVALPVAPIMKPAEASSSSQETSSPNVVAPAVLEELERLRKFVKMHSDVTEDELQKKHQELQKEWKEAEKIRRELEEQEKKRERALEKLEEEKRKFEAGKSTFRIIRREVREGKTRLDQIPEQFKHSYEAYQRLDDAGLLDLPDDPSSDRVSEWEKYLEIIEEIKIEEFEHDRNKYISIRDQIGNGKITETDIDPHFMPQYNVFTILEECEELHSKNAYDIFIETLSTYMMETNQAKWGFGNDISYMRDVNTDKRSQIKKEEVAEESKDEKNEEVHELSKDEVAKKYGIISGPDALNILESSASFLDAPPEDD